MSDNSLAFLYGGPDQTPADLERNQGRAGEIRRDFTAFCEANAYFANWRQAWSAFMAQRACQAEPEPVPQPEARPLVQTSVVPLWRQRLRTMANLHA